MWLEAWLGGVVRGVVRMRGKETVYVCRAVKV